MEDINSPKLSGEKTANKLADKLNSGLFKQLSDHELDVFKQNLANRLKLVQDGPPSDINESILNPDYFSNLRPEGNWYNEIDIPISKDPDTGEYRLGLDIYGTKGQTRVKNRSVSLEQFTPEYIISKVSEVYRLNDVDKQELTDFVNSIPSELKALEAKKGGSSIKERLKDMIRKELMGGNEDETALRDDYMFKLNAYKNMKKNRASEFEMKQAREALVQAAKAYGIDLPA